MADRCAQDEVQDRLHESCIALGIPPTMNPDDLSARLRPVIPRELRELVLNPDHFDAESGFSQRVYNDLLAMILVQSESQKILRDSRNPTWCYDVQCNPDHQRYVGPTGMSRL